MKIFYLMITVAMVTFLAGVAHADVDSCDDYLARHYKQDLKPVSLSFTNHQFAGDISWPHQKVKILVKNVGQVTLGANQSGYKNIRVKIGTKTEYGSIQLPLASGAQTYIHLSLPADSLKRCKNYLVALDTDRKIGQWGCQVFANDAMTLTAQSGRLACLGRAIFVNP